MAKLVANYLNNLITPDRYPLNQDTNIRLCGGDKTGSNPVLTTNNKIMVITYITNTLFIIFILFVIWFVVCSIIYRDQPSNDLTGQSERQKRNDDYNNDYYP